ncbi:MAG: pat [Acidimicrobiaceae bacterium]|nr:pat [Acidimicrobiaceae bacterium]
MTLVGVPGIRPRAAVDAMAAYRPGRSAVQAMEEHRIAEAVKLASNELAWGPLPAVEAALAAGIADLNRYPDHKAQALRAKLGERHAIEPSCVAVGAGTVGLLQQLVLAYVEPGDEVVFGDPSFEAYPIFTALAEGVARPVPLRRLRLDVDRLAGSLNERTRLMLVAQPNNPTGTALAGADLARLAAFVPASCLLVIDEAYHEFASGRHLLEASALLGDHENVVVLRSFSKAHGLAGARIGYALAAAPVVEALDKILIPFSVSSLAQLGALASLDAPEELRARVEAVVSERSRVVHGLASLGWGIPAPEGNFVWLPAGESAAELAVLLEERGVVTRPFPRLGVRVTIGDVPDNDRFLERFAEVAGGRFGEALAKAWLLLCGDHQQRVNRWSGRLEAVEARLVVLERGGPRSGLTDPDAGGEERWQDTEVWAHLAELGEYWTRELLAVLDAPEGAAVGFGRTKADAARRAAVANARGAELSTYVAKVLASIDRLRAELAGMDARDFGRRGRHPSLGEMDVDAILEEFLVGHLEEHVDQLERLGA